ncbi:hypothetical protein KP696_33260 [Nocardia seriolae]|uniref:DUF3267 domain-containing protein n=1 Tax=Nocardia seriolae TaxID=37332 RepID=A0ABC9YMN2_9NOCA|nr:hypothetical protein NS07_v2contig00006-0002 [Nocardia seriolae]GAP26732.1 hypothetical protein NSK11_contig00008-0103 [Nocardia seriolae]
MAEFAALRAEIDTRISLQQAILVLQLTTAGAIFSFALSNPSRTRFLLILPLTTYALCARHSLHHFGIVRLGTYIRESLSRRVPGELQWEDWLIAHPRVPLRFVAWANPLYLTFPGAAALALAWSAPRTFASRDDLSVPLRVGFSGIWLVGLAATALCLYLVWTITAAHRYRIPPAPTE